ncbi:MAG: DUF723 domain-containing protein [Promethearchaeati archaeon]
MSIFNYLKIDKIFYPECGCSFSLRERQIEIANFYCPECGKDINIEAYFRKNESENSIFSNKNYLLDDINYIFNLKEKKFTEIKHSKKFCANASNRDSKFFPNISDNKNLNKFAFNGKEDYANYLNNEIINHLNEKYSLDSKYVPTICELVKEGYIQFIKAFYENGLKYSEIISKLNLSQKRVYRKKSIKNLANELIHITQCLREVLDLKFHQAPNPNQLINLGYRGFVVFLQKYNFNYVDIVNEAGLEYRNWKSDLLNFEDMLELASEKEIIFPYTRETFEKMIKNRSTSPSHIKFNWICPDHGVWKTTYNTLINTKYGCPDCYRESLSLKYMDCVKLAKSKGAIFAMSNEEFETAKFKEILDSQNEKRKPKTTSKIPLVWECKQHGKWETTYNVLKNTAIGCPICALEIWKEKISISYEDYYKLGLVRDDLNCVIDEDLFQERISSTDTPPSLVHLPWKCTANHNHGIWLAPYSRIKRGHGCPYCQERIRVIGILTHPILEYYSIKFLRLKNCNVNYEREVMVKDGYHPDLFISRDLKFIKKIEKNQYIIQFPDHISEISIDFTFSLEDKIILQKCFKNYQSKFRYLLIILLRENEYASKDIFQNIIDVNEEIFMPKHIKVINLKDYKEFLMPKLLCTPREIEVLSKLSKAQKLGIEAINSDKKFTELIMQSKKHTKLLKKL